MSRELNLRQQKFVQYYIESGNATKALKMAGYETKYPDRYANEMLGKPHIKKLLEKTREQLEKKSEVTFMDKIKLLWEIANKETSKETDKIDAIEVMNKMQGHNAPEKSIHDNKNTNTNTNFNLNQDVTAVKDLTEQYLENFSTH